MNLSSYICFIYSAVDCVLRKTKLELEGSRLKVTEMQSSCQPREEITGQMSDVLTDIDLE